jgi:hypothetical protein
MVRAAGGGRGRRAGKPTVSARAGLASRCGRPTLCVSCVSTRPLRAAHYLSPCYRTHVGGFSLSLSHTWAGARRRAAGLAACLAVPWPASPPLLLLTTANLHPTVWNGMAACNARTRPARARQGSRRRPLPPPLVAARSAPRRTCPLARSACGSPTAQARSPRLRSRPRRHTTPRHSSHASRSAKSGSASRSPQPLAASARLLRG